MTDRPLADGSSSLDPRDTHESRDRGHHPPTLCGDVPGFEVENGDAVCWALRDVTQTAMHLHNLPLPEDVPNRM